MYRLQVIATDIIAEAVRMSMSIPLFFEPVRLEDGSGKIHIIVDGGVLSNYPVWLMDDGTSSPPWPTFGFKLMEKNTREIKKADSKDIIHNPLSYLMALVGTMIGAHDNFYISKSKGDYDRTIGIPTTLNIDGIEKEIKTTYFDITQEESLKLYDTGKKTAEEFIKRWDFEVWKKKYRQ